ncbi:MAG: hypothetical protein NVS3B10_21940 [Polyangiales bacterium]
MEARRKRKHSRIDVSGDLRVAPRIPPWEEEMLLAALTAIEACAPTPEREAPDAKR